jgi:hypothetical protein
VRLSFLNLVPRCRADERRQVLDHPREFGIIRERDRRSGAYRRTCRVSRPCSGVLQTAAASFRYQKVNEYPALDEMPQADTYRLYVPCGSPDGSVKSADSTSPGVLGAIVLKLEERA